MEFFLHLFLCHSFLLYNFSELRYIRERLIPNLILWYFSGGLSIAIPGEVNGLWTAHQRFGKLPWASLVEPSIKLCEEGITVSWHQARALRIKKEAILNNPEMR